jgi:fructokinase
VKTSARPLIFGEVLFDRFPDGSEVLGGAPFNVAWNLQGLGLEPLLISAVGDDDLGRRVLAAMDSWGMARSGVQVDPLHETGIVNVNLRDGEPSFEIVADRAWDKIERDLLPDLPQVGLVYHGTLASRQQASRGALADLLRRVRAPVFVDVNLRAPWWNRETVLSSLKAVQTIKMNETELLDLAPGGGTLDAGAKILLERYRPELLCVTRGEDGAVAYTPARTLRVAPPGKRAAVVDTVGAGDAFAAVLIAGTLCDWPMETTLDRAQSLAGQVVGLQGAVTEDIGFYRRFRTEWKIA